jgi:uncharacterized protein (TIGR03067 family)
VDKQSSLPARPNLDHLRGQAKKLLKTLAAIDGEPPKLADAQFLVAREAGFKSWAHLVRHVEALRGLEGEWRIAKLEIDGAETPPVYLEGTRISMDGDRFRTESPGATYEGIFAIDTEASPPHFDIHFIAGPEAGNTNLGIYRIEGDHGLVLCLGLVVGAARPASFATTPGSGFALETLRRTSTVRPRDVTGGTPPPEEDHDVAPRGDEADFTWVDTPLARRLQGAWKPTELVIDGSSMQEPWLLHGSRTMTDNHTLVVFGGQKMVDAKVRIDETASPIAIDYFHLSGKDKGTVTYGILAWEGEDVRIAMASAGAARPTSFDATRKGTITRWRRA